MNEAKTKANGVLGDVPDALRRLLQAEVSLGRSLFESVFGTPLPGLDASPFKTGGLCKSKCDIPPPCWMPQPLGECTSHASPCSDVCIQILIENCGIERRRVRVAAQGYDQLTVTPADVELGPFERKRVEVCASIPKSAKAGTVHDVTVVIAGCKVHYLRWTISVGTFGLETGHQITVKDCPDNIHHWYDHFYCPRPCPRGNLKLPDAVPGRAPAAAAPAGSSKLG